MKEIKLHPGYFVRVFRDSTDLYRLDANPEDLDFPFSFLHNYLVLEDLSVVSLSTLEIIEPLPYLIVGGVTYSFIMEDDDTKTNGVCNSKMIKLEII